MMMRGFISLFGLSAVALMLFPMIATADDLTDRGALVGSWRLNRHNVPRLDFITRRRSEPTLALTFGPATLVTLAIQYPNLPLAASTEVLEAKGLFFVRDGRLTIHRSPISGGWLVNDPEHRHQTCTLKMADDRRSFELADCEFAGMWMR